MAVKCWLKCRLHLLAFLVATLTRIPLPEKLKRLATRVRQNDQVIGKKAGGASAQLRFLDHRVFQQNPMSIYDPDAHDPDAHVCVGA